MKLCIVFQIDLRKVQSRSNLYEINLKIALEHLLSSLGPSYVVLHILTTFVY